jgi:hypothetical protein
MNRILGILLLTVTAFAATGRLHAQDRQPVRDRDLIDPLAPRPADKELDALLEGIARDAMAKVGTKAEPPRPKVDERLKALIVELTARLQPVLEAELRFARSVCGLSDEQAARISPDVAVAFKETVQNLAEVERSEQTGLWVARSKEARHLDLRMTLQHSLVRAIRQRLSVEQAERYSAEVASRRNDWERACVLALVARLDRLLILSSAQRDQLSASLSSHWNEAWFDVADTENDVPSLPNNFVLPFLTQTQRDVWVGTVKVEVRAGGIGGLIRDAEIELNHQDGAEAPELPRRRR